MTRELHILLFAGLFDIVSAMYIRRATFNAKDN